MLTLGVAGHVDHGKTSLVRALTGIETDRLPEEQRRGISIELGFAHLDLDLGDGRSTRVGFVDMPGHERFVRRMISGAAGVDAVLLVVAADEGVMPQGREHLAICRLLGVRRGAVVLTKVDLVDDFMRELVREDVAALVEDSFLQTAPVWEVSVRQPESVDALRRQLAGLARTLLDEQAAQAVAAEGRPFRLWVDRSFVLHGRGTVVAGTASAGAIAVDQPVQVWPGGAVFRVRSLEQHGRTWPEVRAPGRVALNLAGAAVDDVPVGALVAAEGSLLPSARIDALLHLLPHVKAPLPVRQRAMIHVGTTQVEGAVVQLRGEPQEPGTAAPVQIHLDRPLALAPGEGFVVRGSQVDARFGQTFAGGRVLHPAPRRHKLADAEALAALDELAGPRLEGQVAALVQLAGVRGETDASLPGLSAAGPAAVARAVKTLLASGRIRRAGTPPRYFAPAAIAWIEAQILKIVKVFHKNQPHRPGIEADQVHRLLGAWLDAPAVAALVAGLVKRGALVQQGALLAEPGFQPKATARPEVLEALVARLQAQDLATATPAVLAEELGEPAADVAAALQTAVAAGRVVRIAEDHYATLAAVQAAVARVLEAFVDRASFTTGELKDLLGLTRKHLIPFAEYLDAERVTVRDPSGNRRVRDRARQAYLAERGQGS